MDLRESMTLKAQTMRAMAADNLRSHRKFRASETPACREMADWYEGRYMAFKRAAKMITDTLEMYV